MKYKMIVCLAVMQMFSGILLAQVSADDIIGTWQTGGKEPAKIQVYKYQDKYYGRIIWLKYPEKDGKPRVDKKNPDESKRDRQIIGLTILNGFRFDEDDAEWDNGKIYDPESGKTYSCYISLKDKNTLKVRGYVGISLFGRTEIWARTN
jgi:uncharacterized protein (DUF2147 family)